MEGVGRLHHAVDINLNKWFPLSLGWREATVGPNGNEAVLNRIITRILLVFWALWFGLRALAAFGGNGAISSDDLSSGLPLATSGLLIGVALIFVAALFVWAFMAATVGEGVDDDDVLVITKIAFSAGATWLGSHCLFQASAAGNPLAPDGIAPMILLLVSFAIASREMAWMPIEMVEERRSHVLAEAMAAAASYQAELVRFSGRGDMPREHI